MHTHVIRLGVRIHVHAYFYTPSRRLTSFPLNAESDERDTCSQAAGIIHDALSYAFSLSLFLSLLLHSTRLCHPLLPLPFSTAFCAHLPPLPS